MTWILEQNITGGILFIAYFILYGLEYLIPLVPKRSNHFRTNALLALILVLVNLVFTSTTFALSDWVERNEVGLFNYWQIPLAAQVCLSVVILDFWAGYIAHVIFHKHWLLWQLHAVHHTDELVDVTTAFRQHPVESIIRLSFNFSGMVALGIPSWILLIYLTLSTINSQIEHANIRIPAKIDRWLQYIIVTPNMHKIHHSKYQRETDSNYSNIFSFWDRIFGTYNVRRNYTSIRYGLDYIDSNKKFGLFELLHLPFKYAAPQTEKKTADEPKANQSS